MLSIAYIAKISIQHLDIAVNDFQRYQLVIAGADSSHEEQASITPIDDLRVYKEKLRHDSARKKLNLTFIFEEITHSSPSRQNKLCDVLNDLGLLLVWYCHKPFREPHFAMSTNTIIEYDLETQTSRLTLDAILTTHIQSNKEFKSNVRTLYLQFRRNKTDSHAGFRATQVTQPTLRT